MNAKQIGIIILVMVLAALAAVLVAVGLTRAIDQTPPVVSAPVVEWSGTTGPISEATNLHLGIGF